MSKYNEIYYLLIFLCIFVLLRVLRKSGLRKIRIICNLYVIFRAAAEWSVLIWRPSDFCEGPWHYFEDSSVINSSNRYERTIRKAIEINNDKDKVNREAVLLSTTLYPLRSGLTLRELTDRTSTIYNWVCLLASWSHRPEDTPCNMGETLSHKTFSIRSIPEEDCMAPAAEAYVRM